MESNKEAQEHVRAFWEDYLNTGNSGSIEPGTFAPNYTFQGEPLTGEGTNKFMQSLFEQFTWWHFTILDLFGEQQGNVNKVVVRSVLQASLKENGQKLRAMATNILTIGEDGIISNWQTGPTSIDQMTKVDYFLFHDPATD